MTDLAQLIAEIEALPKRSRGTFALEERVRDVLDPKLVRVPKYFSNEHDAISGIRAGHRYLLDKRPDADMRHDGYRAHVWRGACPSYESTETHQPTAARALTVAALKAELQMRLADREG